MSIEKEKVKVETKERTLRIKVKVTMTIEGKVAFKHSDMAQAVGTCVVSSFTERVLHPDKPGLIPTVPVRHCRPSLLCLSVVPFLSAGQRCFVRNCSIYGAEVTDAQNFEHLCQGALYVILSKLLLGVSPRSGLFAPE